MEVDVDGDVVGVKAVNQIRSCGQGTRLLFVLYMELMQSLPRIDLGVVGISVIKVQLFALVLDYSSGAVSQKSMWSFGLLSHRRSPSASRSRFSNPRQLSPGWPQSSRHPRMIRGHASEHPQTAREILAVKILEPGMQAKNRVKNP